MRPIWSGAISFGLVNIPIRLYSATEDHRLSFHMLHKTDMSPIGYVKVCKEEGEEVSQADIVKGYEFERGRYVIISDEDLERASPRKTKTIDISDFVLVGEIDSMYFEKPYYLEPDKGADKAYSLLRDALAKSGKVGVAKFVLRNRESLVVIKPLGGVLVLDQLRFSDEIRQPEGLKTPDVEVQDREMDMAVALIDQLTDSFQPEKYKDTYTDAMLRVIHEKIEGKEPEPGEPEPEISSEVPDLVALLKASLEKPSQQSDTAEHKEKHKEPAKKKRVA